MRSNKPAFNLIYDLENFKMSQTVRLMSDSNIMNINNVDDPLKGFLMDKGRPAADKNIRIVQRKLVAVEKAMMELVNDQRLRSAQAHCEVMGLYMASTNRGEKLPKTNSQYMIADEIYSLVKNARYLEWRGKNSFCTQFGLTRSARLYPFDPSHDTYNWVKNYVEQQSPNFYKVLAAYDNVRETLNSTAKALRRTLADCVVTRIHAEQIPVNLFDRETARISKDIFMNLKELNHDV